MGLFCVKNIKVRVFGFIKLVSLGGAGYGSWQFKNGSEQPRNFNGWKSEKKFGFFNWLSGVGSDGSEVYSSRVGCRWG
jgi:hypothetical protein